MDNKQFEYQMLRTEILQYLGEYQNLRNMMYVCTFAAFAFIVDQGKYQYFLLPLIIIVPSYLVSLDYFYCIVRDAQYLHIFFEETQETADSAESEESKESEDSPNPPAQWETNLELFNKKVGGTFFFPQTSPYTVCWAVCLLLHWLSWFENKIIDKWFWSALVISILTGFIFIFFNYRQGKSVDKISSYWREIKEEKTNQKG